MTPIYRHACSVITISALCFSSLVQAAPVSGQGTWETTLQGRDLDGIPATFEAYYDTALDITWLADANGADANGFLMSWSDANAWAAGLTVGGVSGWRLPATNPINGSTYDYDYAVDGTTDYGNNMSAAGTLYEGSHGSEMAHMFYVTLGNKAYYDTDGNIQPGFGPVNTANFSNVLSYGYWSATEYASYTDLAWFFALGFGTQSFGDTGASWAAWAVHPGDVSASAVPLPAGVWLLGSGLLGMFGVTRKRRSRADLVPAI